MKLKKTKIRLFISVLIFSWLFFGWPQIGFDTLATSFNFPPGLQDAYASHNYVHANTTAEVELDQIEINATAVTKGQPSGKKSARDTAVGASFEEVTVP